MKKVIKESGHVRCLPHLYYDIKLKKCRQWNLNNKNYCKFEPIVQF